MASTEKLIRITLQLNDKMSKELKKSSSGLDKFAGKMTKVGAGLTAGLTLPIVALGIAAVKTAIDIESAWAGVTKTVEGTSEQMDELRSQLADLATGDSPVSALKNANVELLKIAEAAGQLGVARGDVVKFTETMAALSMATNIVGEDGSRSLAQFANAAQFDLKNVDKLGDVIVELGNNLATTEQEILTFGQRMGTLSQIGFEAEELLAFGGAMASIGINAEAGASAFTAGAQKIAVAAASGGVGLATLSNVAGTTQSAFASMFESDPASAMQDFIEGLGTLELTEQVAALESLGITGVRARAAFLGLAGDTEGLASALDLAGGAIVGNGALMDEAGKRAETTAGMMNKLQNNITLLADEFGQVMLPILNDVIPVITNVVKWFANLDDGTKKWIVGIAAVLAVIGPLLILFGAIASAISSIVALAPAMAGAWVAITGPVGLLVIGIAAAVAALWFLVTNFETVMNFIKGILSVFVAGDFIGGIGVDEDHPIVGFLFGIRNGLIDFAEWISQFIPHMVELIGDGFLLLTNPFALWQKIWRTNFLGIRTMLTDFTKNIVETLKGLAGQIGTILGALPKVMGTIAVNIMTGLITGIKSKLAEWLNTLRNMVTATVNMVRSAFQIRSPSKVMAKLGEQVGAGFNVGLENMGGFGVNVPQINGANASSPSLAVGGAGASGGAGNIFIEKAVFELPQGTTDAMIKDISRKLGKLAKKRGAQAIK